MPVELERKIPTGFIPTHSRVTVAFLCLTPTIFNRLMAPFKREYFAASTKKFTFKDTLFY